MRPDPASLFPPTRLSGDYAQLLGLTPAPTRCSTFDLYPLDLAGRAQAFQKLVGGGMEVSKAAALSGLIGLGD